MSRDKKQASTSTGFNSESDWLDFDNDISSPSTNWRDLEKTGIVADHSDDEKNDRKSEYKEKAKKEDREQSQPVTKSSQVRVLPKVQDIIKNYSTRLISEFSGIDFNVVTRLMYELAVSRSRSSLSTQLSTVDLISLFGILSNITSHGHPKSYSDTWANGHGINQALEHVLGNIAYIIHPELSSVRSPASDDFLESIEGSVNYIKEISGYICDGVEIKNGFMHRTEKKPMVMVWNTQGAKARSSIDTSAEGGRHWQACIILPKNYKPIFGADLNNPNEIIIFVDSLNNVAIPPIFKFILQNRFNFPFNTDRGIKTHIVGGSFANAQLISCRNVLQQLGGQDCGWWAVYNVIMVVFTGRTDYLSQFTRRSREPAYVLRRIFPGLIQAAAIGANKTVPKVDSLKQGDIDAIGEALRKQLLQEKNLTIEEFIQQQKAIEESVKAKKQEEDVPNIDQRVINRGGMSMDREHIDGLNSLTSKLDEFLNSPSQKSFDKLGAEFYRFMNTLFFYYGKAECHTDPIKFLQAKIGKRSYSQDFPKVLAEVVRKNEDKVFLKLCPFAHIVVLIDSVIGTGFSIQNFRVLQNANRQLKCMVNEVLVVKPLREMLEFIKAARGQEVDIGLLGNNRLLQRDLRDSNVSLAMVAASIKKAIPYLKRAEWPYNVLNWRAIEVLGNQAFTLENSPFISAIMPYLSGDLKTLGDVVKRIIVFELTKFDEKPLKPIITPINLKIIYHFNSFFEDPLNIERIEYYLSGLGNIYQDNRVNRLAIMRILTAIGEASKNLSQTAKSYDINLFNVLESIRDCIVHSDQFPSIEESIDELLDNPHNVRLLDFAAQDLPRICTFFQNLHKCRKGQAQELEPIMPHLRILPELYLDLAKNFKLTRQERNNLLATIPAEDTRIIGEQRERLSDLLHGRTAQLPNSQGFKELCKGLGLPSRKLNDLYFKLGVKLSITATINGIKNKTYDEKFLREKLEKLNAKLKDGSIVSLLSEKILNTEAVNKILEEHQYTIITNKEIGEILERAPAQEIDIRADKRTLRRLVTLEADIPDINTLKTLLDRAGITNAIAQQRWFRALDILNGIKPSSYRLNTPRFIRSNSIHNSIIRHINKVAEAIKILFELTKTLPSFEMMAFINSKPLMFACEYVFGLFLEHAKGLHSKIEKVKDYTDIRARSIFFRHPIDELMSELARYIFERNDVFHLHSMYDRSHETIFAEQIRLYNTILHRTRGILFSESIVVRAGRVSIEPTRSASLLEKLIYVKRLVLDEQQKNYWQELSAQPLTQTSICERSLALNAFKESRMAVFFQYFGGESYLLNLRGFNIISQPAVFNTGIARVQDVHLRYNSDDLHVFYIEFMAMRNNSTTALTRIAEAQISLRGSLTPNNIFNLIRDYAVDLPREGRSYIEASDAILNNIMQRWQQYISQQKSTATRSISL